MGILLTLFYSLLLSYGLVYWSKRLPEPFWSPSMLIGFLGIKIAFGVLYAWIHQVYYLGDTWAYFEASQLIYGLFSSHPLDFFQLTLLPLPDEIPIRWQFIEEGMGYWHETAGYTMVRLHALLSLFSFGHYSVHLVFWEFFSLIGLLYVYSFFTHFVTDKSKKLLYLFILMPSVLFWLSGVHKGGVCVFGVGILLNGALKILKPSQILRAIGYIVLGVLLLFLIRPYILILLFPALLAFVLTYFYPRYTLLKYVGIYSFLTLLVVGLGNYEVRFSLLDRLVLIQEHFLLYYNGNSDIAIEPLQPTLWSFIKVAPQALFNALCRPTYWDTYHLRTILASVEITALWGFLLYCIFRYKGIFNKPLFYFCLFFSISYFLLIGYTIDNLGAIVRYRALPFLFLVPAFMMLGGFLKEKR